MNAVFAQETYMSNLIRRVAGVVRAVYDKFLEHNEYKLQNPRRYPGMGDLQLALTEDQKMQELGIELSEAILSSHEQHLKRRKARNEVVDTIFDV